MSHRPDGELYQLFRNQFLSYSMYISKISLIVLVTLLCNNDLFIVLLNLVWFSIQILFSFSSTTTRVAACIDFELLEKDITWTSQLVGSFLICFSLLFCRCISINRCFDMCFMIRGVSVLDVQGSDFSPAVPFLGPCKFYTAFDILGLFCNNKCNPLVCANSSLPVLWPSLW